MQVATLGQERVATTIKVLLSALKKHAKLYQDTIQMAAFEGMGHTSCSDLYDRNKFRSAQVHVVHAK